MLNNKFASCLVLFSAIFAYFPFVGFVPKMDLQPLFFLAAFLCVVFLIWYCKVGISFVLAILLGAGLVLSHFAFIEEAPEFKYLLTYLLAIFAIFFFYVFYPEYYGAFLNSKLIYFAFLIYAVVGVIQFFYPEFLAFAVTRSVDAALSYSETGRGVRSLTGEPSSLGKMFNLLNALYVLSLVVQGKVLAPSRVLIISFVFLVANIVIARSAYAAGIHFFLISVLWLLIARRSFFVFIILACLAFVITAAALISILNEIQDVRMVGLIFVLMNEPEMILQQGAMRRVLNIPISLNNLAFYGFNGAGNSPDVFNGRLWTPLGYLHYYGHSRNIGGFVEFILKFGVFSIPIILLYFMLLLKALSVTSYFTGAKSRIGIYFLLSGLLLSFQDSSPALPLALLFVVGAARVYDIQKSSNRIAA